MKPIKRHQCKKVTKPEHLKPLPGMERVPQRTPVSQQIWTPRFGFPWSLSYLATPSLEPMVCGVVDDPKVIVSAGWSPWARCHNMLHGLCLSSTWAFSICSITPPEHVTASFTHFCTCPLESNPLNMRQVSARWKAFTGFLQCSVSRIQACFLPLP